MSKSIVEQFKDGTIRANKLGALGWNTAEFVPLTTEAVHELLVFDVIDIEQASATYTARTIYELKTASNTNYKLS